MNIFKLRLALTCIALRQATPHPFRIQALMEKRTILLKYSPRQKEPQVDCKGSVGVYCPFLGADDQFLPNYVNQAILQMIDWPPEQGGKPKRYVWELYYADVSNSATENAKRLPPLNSSRSTRVRKRSAETISIVWLIGKLHIANSHILSDPPRLKLHLPTTPDREKATKTTILQDTVGMRSHVPSTITPRALTAP